MFESLVYLLYSMKKIDFTSAYNFEAVYSVVVSDNS